MFRRIWQAIVQFFRHLFGLRTSSQSSSTGRRNPTYLSSREEAREAEPPRPLENADYEFLFMQLLEGISHGWQQQRVLKFFTDLERRTTEEQWIVWLRGFGERLLASPAPNQELAVRMLQMQTLGCGELGEVAGEIGNQLLYRTNMQSFTQPIQNNLNFPETALLDPTGYEMTAEPQAISLDQLWEILQQDTELAQQMSEVLQIQSSEPEGIIQALINQGEGGNQSILDDGNSIQFTIAKNPGQSGNIPDIIEAEFTQYTNQDISRIDEIENSQLTTNEEQIQNWFNQGFEKYQLGAFEEAIAFYDRAIELNPNYYIIWLNRGNALIGLERYEEGLANYDKALAIKLDVWVAWINRGTAAANSANCDPLFASVSLIATQNPALKQRGYEGELASYQEGLKYVHPETEPEGWGILHLCLGNAYYNQGRIDTKPLEYCRKAVIEYREALKTLTKETFPEWHLEVLQDFLKALLDLGEISEAERLLPGASTLLQRLLADPNRSELQKKQLAIKFISFQQIKVNLVARSGQLIQALELAEKDKNVCLAMILDNGNEDISSPSWAEIQQLLNPTTAIVYWHLSPSNLTTFILKHDVAEPIVLREAPLTEKTNFPIRVVELENWIKDWNKKYQEYRNLQPKEREKQLWWPEFQANFTHLSNILDISEVIAELSDIENIILIPHRDLHRLPLHYLFPDNFTVTYLPSAKTGLNPKNTAQIDRLLSVEVPNSEKLAPLEYAEIEATAISQMFDNSTRLIDQNATKEKVIAALSDEYGIFHFTGHGDYSYTIPSQSTLYLSGQDRLTLEEICQLPLANYHLVCLTACESAIATNHTIPTEYVSLATGFAWKGVAHVLSTLWTVPENSTALLSIEFYRRLKAKISPPKALKQAQHWLRTITHPELVQWYKETSAELADKDPAVSQYLNIQGMYMEGNQDQINSTQPPYAHPYYWAAFMITGV